MLVALSPERLRLRWPLRPALFPKKPRVALKIVNRASPVLALRHRVAWQVLSIAYNILLAFAAKNVKEEFLDLRIHGWPGTRSISAG